MHIALKGCRPPHTNEPVPFWIGTDWIIQLVIDRNAIENL